MRKVVVGIVLLIVFVILIFQIVGSSSVDLTDAADSVTDANNCSLSPVTSEQEALVYNISDKFCYNESTGADKVYLAGQFDLPLNTLFSSGGILMLIFMAVIFIIAIMTVITGLKKQK